MIPQLMEELKKANAEDITVIIGGVIPKQDYQFLLDANVKGIFGPGTPDGKALAEGFCAVAHVALDPATGQRQKTPLPEELRRRLLAPPDQPMPAV